VGTACGWPQDATFPDTPAGHALQAWFESFNSGDRARIQAYLAKYQPAKSVDGTIAFRDQTGAFQLLGIDKSEKLHIEFRVKEMASPTTALGKMDVKDADPSEVVIYPRIIKGILRSTKRSQIRPDQLGVRLHLPKDAGQ
jgi:hypothetical protein